MKGKVKVPTAVGRVTPSAAVTTFSGEEGDHSGIN